MVAKRKTTKRKNKPKKTWSIEHVADKHSLTHEEVLSHLTKKKHYNDEGIFLVGLMALGKALKQDEEETLKIEEKSKVLQACMERTCINDKIIKCKLGTKLDETAPTIRVNVKGFVRRNFRKAKVIDVEHIEADLYVSPPRINGNR